MLPCVATFRCLHSRNLSFSRAPHWRLSGFEAVSRLSFRRVYRALYDFLWESGDFNAKTPVPSLSYWLLSSFTLQFHHFSKRHGSSQRGWGQKWPGKIQVKNWHFILGLVWIFYDRSFSNLTSFFLQRNSRFQMLLVDLRIRVPIAAASLFSRENDPALPGFLPRIYEQLCQCLAWRIARPDQM